MMIQDRIETALASIRAIVEAREPEPPQRGNVATRYWWEEKEEDDKTGE